VYYSVGSISVLRTGQVASAITDFTLPGTTLELNATIEAKAISGVTGSCFFWNWTTSTWVYIGSMPLTATDSTKTFSAGTQYSKYVNAQNKVRVLFRGIFPIKTGQTPLQYQLRIDRVSAGGST
jgi:hypothetical protein